MINLTKCVVFPVFCGFLMHFGPVPFYQQICLTDWVEEYCLLSVSTLGDLPIFVCDFPLFFKAREMYLFICPRERRAYYVVSIWPSVSREDWIQTGVLKRRIVLRIFLFLAVWVQFWRTN